MKTEQMLATHPRKSELDSSVVAACIAACIECADACNSCADACLGEQMVQNLTRCIRLNLDCADICQTTARIVSRQTDMSPEILRSQIESCIVACRVCGQECEQHAEMHQHCRICRTACQTCEKICQEGFPAFLRQGLELGQALCAEVQHLPRGQQKQAKGPGDNAVAPSFSSLPTLILSGPQKSRTRRNIPIIAMPMASLPATPIAIPTTVPKPARLA